MLVQSFINEYNNDAVGYYNSLIRRFNASKEISIQSYIQVNEFNLQGNVNAFKNTVDYLGFEQFENNLIANYSKELDIHYLNFMWLAYLKDVDPAYYTHVGQSSHFGGIFGDQGGQS
uniref:Uncharacterized protein n=1 Tax=Meloidogyne enterolobii TaxID=390850 RepID=A0A6V7XNR7_MELEN|nr:unnamed protein product [Meloidogyne enterolobii]